MILAVAAAGPVLLAQAGRFSNRLDAFTHFAPLYAAMAVAAASLWLVGGRRGRLAPLISLAALAGAALLMAPELAAAARAERVKPGAETLKIVQFNLFYLNSAPKAAADWIIAQDADVVVVEESYDNASEVLRRLETAYPHVTPCPGGRPCSVRILSKREPLRSPAHRPVRGYGSVASASFAGEGFTYAVVGVHYVWPDPVNPQRLNRQTLRRSLQGMDRENLILTGDFNSTPWSFALRRQDRQLGLERRTRALFSWSPRPGLPRILPIDHLYAGSGWKTVSVRRGPRLGSDHYPVIAVLTR